MSSYIPLGKPNNTHLYNPQYNRHLDYNSYGDPGKYHIPTISLGFLFGVPIRVLSVFWDLFEGNQ